MRVFLKNIVTIALEQGVVSGLHQVTKLPKTKRTNPDIVAATILTSVWKSLDNIVDFKEEDEDDDDAVKRSAPMGFSVAGVSTTTLTAPPDEE